MVPPLSRDLSSRATHRRSWLVSHAQDACIDASDEGGPINLWHGFAVQFEPTARACAHLPDRARSLRAAHRVLRVHSRRAVAWQRHDHPDHHAVCTTTISRCAPTASVRYTQNLNPVSNSFSPRPHARCIARTRPHTHVCFERATTEVVFVHSTPYLHDHRGRIRGAPPTDETITRTMIHFRHAACYRCFHS